MNGNLGILYGYNSLSQGSRKRPLSDSASLGSRIGQIWALWTKTGGKGDVAGLELDRLPPHLQRDVGWAASAANGNRSTESPANDVASPRAVRARLVGWPNVPG